MSARALASLESVLASGDEADDVLRATVEILASEPGVSWAGVAFLESGALVVGPASGLPDERTRQKVSIAFHGDPVGELQVDGETDRAFLERVAELVAAHVLIGWDTQGERWEA